MRFGTTTSGIDNDVLHRAEQIRSCITGRQKVRPRLSFLNHLGGVDNAADAGRYGTGGGDGSSSNSGSSSGGGGGRVGRGGGGGGVSASYGDSHEAEKMREGLSKKLETPK